jgi:glyceraldehyde-3-phosphate dehydrogenase/erythrose-4-phosphate dehydrogenase
MQLEFHHGLPVGGNVMPARIGINGCGRIGRLALRAGWGRPDRRFVHINEVAGGPEKAARLLMFSIA